MHHIVCSMKRWYAAGKYYFLYSRTSSSLKSELVKVLLGCGVDALA